MRNMSYIGLLIQKLILIWTQLMKHLIYRSAKPILLAVICQLPEEVITTEQFIVPGIALVRQWGPAIGATDAGCVPRALQHMQEELVQDRLLATSTGHRTASFPTS